MFDKKCLRLGLITMCCAVIASFLPALYLWLFHGVIPSPPDIASIAGMMAASFAVGWVVQPITFYPALGVGASCLSWTTGNVGDLRMPAISAAQKAAEVEAGTPEGNVLSTMAAAVTNFVTVIWLTFVVIVGTGLISILPASVTDAFSYIAPAIFGAIVIDYAMKNLRFNVPLIIAAFITYAVLSMLGLSSVWITLLVVIIGMFVSRGVFMIQSKKTEK
ncbi:MAG TPA: hypothetical protein H9719_07095 [Candidatus Intestinimonas stercoravium]|uniref:hypothetical protein n=1 Tax=uncultured Intestinimonas sp. TaxID=1689265 RepID=UPI001F8BA7CD|nr:hypothetical protein [uncultured Intestinimonas sp.]HJA63883.1 hypothetical protein [Candidatus Intestinimonas stercoravium]